MHSPRSGTWRYVPGYDSESDEDWPESARAEAEEDSLSGKERFEDILAVLGDRWVDPPPLKFVPAQVRQKGDKSPPKRPDDRSRNGPAPCFRMDRMLAPVVHHTFLSNGLCETHNSDWCVQWSGPGMKDASWSEVHEYQRVNHFPGSTALTRKDSMYTHLSNMAKHFGKEAFDFLPETYVLPEQMQAFMEEYELNGGLWIVKPANSACGRGIFLLRKIQDLPSGASVVSRYVDNPLLIQGLKFDLRVYVLVTQYDPLRAYIYREGLARFASKPYSTEEQHLKDAYRHLTNYSINKSAPNFTENQDLHEDNYGHKWSLSALNRHLRCVGVDHRAMWSRIMDLIVKTLIAVETSISDKTKRVTTHTGVCFEIYGFDVLVDEDLKPWILEVNLSPSMQADSPLDWQVKSSLLSDAFNLIGVCHAEFRAVQASRLRGQIAQAKASHKALIRERGSNSMTGLGPSPPPKRGSEGSSKRSSTRKTTSGGISPAEVPVVLDTLTEAQLKMLARSLQEFDRCENFIRLYPTRGAVERYRPIMESRGHLRHRSATGSTASNHLLASLLFGPPPRKSTIVSPMLSQPQLQPQPQSKDRDGGSFGSSMRSSYVASLKRSLAALELQKPAANHRAVSSSSEAARPLTPSTEAPEAEESAVDASSASGPEGAETPRQGSEEREEKASRAAHFMTDLDVEDRKRLVLMEYLLRMARTCESLSTEERHNLAQSGAFSRLSKFRARLQMLTSRSSSPPPSSDSRSPTKSVERPSSSSRRSTSGRPNSARPSSGVLGACLVEEITTACRSSLEAVAKLPWRPAAAEAAAAEAAAEQDAEAEEHRGPLAPYLPEGFGLEGPRRQALSVLPVLGPIELEGLLRSEDGSEELGAWAELFAGADGSSRVYSPLRDVLQARRRPRRGPAGAPGRSPSRSAPAHEPVTLEPAALDSEDGLDHRGSGQRRPSLELLSVPGGGGLARNRAVPEWRSLQDPQMLPSPPPPLNVAAPPVSRQWSAPLLPDLKATERPLILQKQTLAERMLRQKSSHLLVTPTFGRPALMYEMDSIEL